jgi:hypothetical protein
MSSEARQTADERVDDGWKGLRRMFKRYESSPKFTYPLWKLLIGALLPCHVVSGRLYRGFLQWTYLGYRRMCLQGFSVNNGR